MANTARQLNALVGDIASAYRQRMLPPSWRNLTLLLALLAMLKPVLGDSALFWPVLIIAGSTLLLTVSRLLRILSISRQAKVWAANLDDSAILAMLPAPAHEDAKRWQQGENRKQAELAMVIHLAVLWTLLGRSKRAHASPLRARLAG